MKCKLQLLLLFVLSHFGYSQNIEITSDFDWEISLSQNGPFDIIPLNTGNCVDELHIDTICGSSYASPSLQSHFSTCKDFEVIWGAEAPGNCIYPAQIYWFKKTFTLEGAEFDNIVDGLAKVQADNSSAFYLNGNLIGGSSPSEWSIVKEYDVISHLIEGENEILIEVNNLNGGTCFNYAFLAFCLDINYTFFVSNEEIKNPDSYVDVFPNPTSDYINIIPKNSSNIQNLTIYAVTGHKLFARKEIIQNELTIPINRWHDGIYILEFEIDNIIFHKRVVISKT